MEKIDEKNVAELIGDIENCPVESPAEENSAGKGVKFLFYTKEVLSTVIPAALAAFFLFWVLFRVVSVDGKSMNPTLQNGDIMILQHAFYIPKVGDIVVCESPGFAEGRLVKRVIGVPGDVLEFDFENGIVRRNGTVLDEKYISEKTFEGLGCPQTVRVKVGTCFVMGDNRNNSNDSRNPKIGLIQQDDILGGMLFCIPIGD